MTTDNNILKHASILITLSIAGLYILGTTFYDGYLNELGLEPTQFPLSVDQISFYGFSAIAYMGIKGFFYFFFSFAAFYFIVEFTFFLMYKFKKSTVTENNALSLKKESNKKFKPHPLSNFLWNIFRLLILFFSFLLVLLFILDLSQKYGREFALNFKSKLVSNEYPKKKLKLRQSSEMMTAYSVLCSNSQCAYFIDGLIIIYNKSDIEWEKTLSDEP